MVTESGGNEVKYFILFLGARKERKRLVWEDDNFYSLWTKMPLMCWGNGRNVRRNNGGQRKISRVVLDWKGPFVGDCGGGIYVFFGRIKLIVGECAWWFVIRKHVQCSHHFVWCGNDPSQNDKRHKQCLK